MSARKITSWFSPQTAKKQKTETSGSSQEAVENTPELTETHVDSPPLTSLTLRSAPNNPDSSSLMQESDYEWPSVWSVDQKNEFVNKNEWLVFNKGKLGCSVCISVGNTGVDRTKGMKISTEWVNRQVSFNGEGRKQQLTSLRKKIYEHKESIGHKTSIRIQEEARKQKLEGACLNVLARESEVTSKIFRTAYKVAKKNQSFYNFEDEINLQEMNGLDMGRILHSTNACINIVNHIGTEMRKALVSKIIESKCKVALIIDEASTVSQKSVLIVYFRVSFLGTEMRETINCFLDLIELDSVTASGIFSSLMSKLEALGFTEDFLRHNLVSLTCDGAAVMFGLRGGVSKLLKDKFPSIVVWHCASHRLELSVHDAVKEIGGVNRFKSFIDKLYVTYHASPKNARELQVCASLLEDKLLKIGRILSTRWVASSYNTVLAVWQSYETLEFHFTQSKDDTSRGKKDRCMYEGLYRKISSVNFILDLGLMVDALQELSELSLDLQERNIDLYTAHNKIQSTVEVFEQRKTTPGPAYRQALEAAKCLKFCGTDLHNTEKVTDPAISPYNFYESLKNAIARRLLSPDDLKLSKFATVLDPKKWPSERSILFGEEEICELSRRFCISEREMVRAFREYVKSSEVVPKGVMELKSIFNTIPISSSECERGFSQMNLIMTPERAALLVNTVSNLLFIRIVGPPLTSFDPTKYVKSWLLQGRHSAVDTKSKVRNREEENRDMSELWKIFK